jgi:hypothetical protein
MDSNIITARDGLLWRKGQMLDVFPADGLAYERGLGCCEQLVRLIEKCPLIGAIELDDWDCTASEADGSVAVNEWHVVVAGAVRLARMELHELFPEAADFVDGWVKSRRYRRLIDLRRDCQRPEVLP